MISASQAINDARRCAELFRLGRDIEGALDMVELIEATVPLLGQMAPDEQRDGQRILSQILACQERQDWLGLADWLEVEFIELLQTG